MSFKIKLIPGILNLVIFASPIVTSLLTVAELAAASCPIIVLLLPSVRSLVPVLAAYAPIIVLSSPVVRSLAT